MALGRYFHNYLQLLGVKLLDLDFFTKSDPFAKFYRINGQ